MAIDGIVALEYQINYPTLDLKLLKEKPRIFDICLIHAYTKESKRGFKGKKIYKTNKKGTKITYTTIKDEEDFKKFKEEVQDLIDNFNKKYNENIKFETVK